MAATDFTLPEVVILAGGFGTRVRHLLPDVPKPMAPVAGRPFLEWVIRFYARHGATRFALSTGYLAEKVAAHFASAPVRGVVVRCCAETDALGTGGGFINCVQTAAPEADAWLVVNGDSLVFADPHLLVAPLRQDLADATVLGVDVEDASRYGSLEIDTAGRLARFAEKRGGRGTINAGVYAFARSALRRLPERRPLSFETDIFPTLTPTGRVAVVRATAAFLDIGTPDSLAAAEQFILNHLHEFQP